MSLLEVPSSTEYSYPPAGDYFDFGFNHPEFEQPATPENPPSVKVDATFQEEKRQEKKDVPSAKQSSRLAGFGLGLRSKISGFFQKSREALPAYPDGIAAESQKAVDGFKREVEMLETGAAQTVKFAEEALERAERLLQQEQDKCVDAARQQNWEIKVADVNTHKQGLNTYKVNLEKAIPLPDSRPTSQPLAPASQPRSGFWSKLFGKDKSLHAPRIMEDVQAKIIAAQEAEKEIQKEIALAKTLCRLRATVFDKAYGETITIKDTALIEVGLMLEVLHKAYPEESATRITTDNHQKIREEYKIYQTSVFALNRHKAELYLQTLKQEGIIDVTTQATPENFPHIIRRYQALQNQSYANN